MFASNRFGQFVFVLVKQLQEPEHDTCATNRWGVRPTWEGGRRSGHGLINITTVGKSGLARDFAGSGIEYVLSLAGSAF